MCYCLRVSISTGRAIPMVSMFKFDTAIVSTTVL